MCSLILSKGVWKDPNSWGDKWILDSNNMISQGYTFCGIGYTQKASCSIICINVKEFWCFREENVKDSNKGHTNDSCYLWWGPCWLHGTSKLEELYAREQLLGQLLTAYGFEAFECQIGCWNRLIFRLVRLFFQFSIVVFHRNKKPHCLGEHQWQ